MTAVDIKIFPYFEWYIILDNIYFNSVAISDAHHYRASFVGRCQAKVIDPQLVVNNGAAYTSINRT